MNTGFTNLLQYKNNKIIAHFCNKNPQYSRQEAEQLFSDLLAWMFLNLQRKKEGKKTYLFGPLLILDEMWHIFILHTRDYVDFCTTYFAEYFHHEVEPIGFEHHVNEDEINEFLQDCFRYLDVQWVERRFAEAFTEF